VAGTDTLGVVLERPLGAVGTRDPESLGRGDEQAASASTTTEAATASTR
jgi:hypothetical protein